MKLSGKISPDGKLLMSDRDILTNWIAQHKGKSVELEIKVKRKKRSNDQNEYYWAVIVERFFEIFNNAGWDIQSREEVHEMLKDLFNREDKCNQHGEMISVVKSTAKNSTIEAELYYDRCRKWGAEFWGEYIALPNEAIELPIDNIINN